MNPDAASLDEWIAYFEKVNRDNAKRWAIEERADHERIFKKWMELISKWNWEINA